MIGNVIITMHMRKAAVASYSRILISSLLLNYHRVLEKKVALGGGQFGKANVPMALAEILFA